MKTTLHHKETVNKITAQGLVPVFFHADQEICLSVLSSCYRAGLRVFEFTNRGENALEIFTTLKQAISERYGDLLLGAGTIFSSENANRFIAAGADFIVSPALVPNMREILFQVPWIPGCATVSEVHQANALGAPLIKAYPGDLLGPGFIKAVKTVLPTVALMPTGGVEPNKENLLAWFKAGVQCVGMGSKLFDEQVLRTQNWNALELKIESTISLIKEIRNGLDKINA